ncbi:hypothetical protein IF2G_02002 [Cordyceps javanica]|nr:hypothetical protein IF2G_02002 [Cordyceps javanica]
MRSIRVSLRCAAKTTTFFDPLERLVKLLASGRWRGKTSPQLTSMCSPRLAAALRIDPTTAPI